MMSPIQLFDPASFTYTYLLIDQDSRQAIIIDPVDEQIERDLSVIRQYGVKLVYSIETHAHADHLSAAPYLQAQLGGGIGIGKHICAVNLGFGGIAYDTARIPAPILPTPQKSRLL